MIVRVFGCKIFNLLKSQIFYKYPFMIFLQFSLSCCAIYNRTGTLNMIRLYLIVPMLIRHLPKCVFDSFEIGITRTFSE